MMSQPSRALSSILVVAFFFILINYSSTAIGENKHWIEEYYPQDFNSLNLKVTPEEGFNLTTNEVQSVEIKFTNRIDCDISLEFNNYGGIFSEYIIEGSPEGFLIPSNESRSFNLTIQADDRKSDRISASIHLYYEINSTCQDFSQPYIVSINLTYFDNSQDYFLQFIVLIFLASVLFFLKQQPH